MRESEGEVRERVRKYEKCLPEKDLLGKEIKEVHRSTIETAGFCTFISVLVLKTRLERTNERKNERTV